MLCHRYRKLTKKETTKPDEGTGEGSGEVTQGKSRAPDTGKPGSTYEQVDDKGKIMSRTRYGKNGKPEYRDDYDHAHFDKNTQKYLQPHRHPFKYNENGYPIKLPVTPVP